MKISANNSSYIQNKPKLKQNTFKGYFACPIKELHIQSCPYSGQKAFIEELSQKCKKYFDIFVQLKDKVVEPKDVEYSSSGFIKDSLLDLWGQDNKLFMDNGELLILSKSPNNTYAKKLADLLGIKSRATKYKENLEGIIGGNCFLGKKNDGQNFALVGHHTLICSNPSEIAKNLNVTTENLHILPQPDYHIDMAIRPMVYPYVLVGDRKMTKTFATGFSQEETTKEMNVLFANADMTAKRLEKEGFKPIKVPGLFGEDRVNFMNAIVHQEPDGGLIYITNKSSAGEKIGIDFEGIFEKYLKSKMPSVKEVIFIDGDNFVSKALSDGGGGVHCMTSERPDFEKCNNVLR